jgi:hypothetical protein
MAGHAPAWFTPQRLLFLFCCMSLLVYLDRGAYFMQASDALCVCFHLPWRHCNCACAWTSGNACHCASGVISSNGVNGARDAAGAPGYGIQVGDPRSEPAIEAPMSPNWQPV